MATINFYYRGKNETGNLTIRLKHSTSIDYRLSSDIISSRKYWFKTNERHRKLDELSYLGAQAKSHKLFLEKFQDSILLRFKTDFNNGIPISKEWFAKNIDAVTDIINRKDDIENAQNEINQNAQELLDKVQDVHNKNLITSAIQRVIDVEYFNNKDQQKIFKQALNKVSAYQRAKKVELMTKDITQNFIDEFTAFLMKDLQHRISTTRKHCKSLVHSVKYQKNAFPDIVEVSLGVGEIKYIKQSKSEKRKTRSEIVVTLSFDELDQIHNTDVPDRLLNSKKIILFGCEIGLRVSDYDKLTDDNICRVGDLEYWSFWNQKTGIDVVIPITERIKKLITHYGMPRTIYSKSADVVINREMKEVCRLAGIDEVIQSRKSQSVNINNEQTRRTVSMKYPKYEVVSTHSLRRSFATNYKDTLTPYQTRQITGHSSDAQLLEYINQDKNRSEIVKQMASKMNSSEVLRKEKTIQLKVVKNASN